MQRTTFGEIEPAQSSLDLDKYRPTLVVLSGPAHVQDHPSKRYPVQEGSAVITRQIGDLITVHCERTNDPEGVFKRGLPSKNTDFYPRNSVRRFYPQGIDSPRYHPIEQSACIYTRGDASYIGKPGAVGSGPFPLHRLVSKTPTSTQTQTNPPQAPQMSLQHHPGLGYGSSHGSVRDPPDYPLTVNPLDLILDHAKNTDSGYGGSVFGSSVNGQRVKGRSAYDPFTNSGPGEADPEWSFSMGVDGLSLRQTGEQFPEIVIGDIEWAEDD